MAGNGGAGAAPRTFVTGLKKPVGPIAPERLPIVESADAVKPFGEFFGIDYGHFAVRALEIIGQGEPVLKIVRKLDLIDSFRERRPANDRCTVGCGFDID